MSSAGVNVVVETPTIDWSNEHLTKGELEGIRAMAQNLSDQIDDEILNDYFYEYINRKSRKSNR